MMACLTAGRDGVEGFCSRSIVGFVVRYGDPMSSRRLDDDVDTRNGMLFRGIRRKLDFPERFPPLVVVEGPEVG